MVNTHFLTGGMLSARIADTHTTAQHRLTDVNDGNNGSRWMYVYASAAITQYDAVGIEASGTASPLTAALAAAGATIGIAQVAFAAADYGWVALEGTSLRVGTLAAEAVGASLYTSDTAGKVADATASASHWQIQGLFLIATASGTSASSAACVARNLVVRKPAA